MKALRKCRDCGLEAHTEKDLENFALGSRSLYGRANLCRRCWNKRVRLKRRANVRVLLHERFNAMKQRCYNVNHDAYWHYGGRGITICQEWLNNPDLFVEWALTYGFQRGLEIDRVDNDEGYSPDNCRWVTRSQQMRNKRGNVTDFEKGTRICEVCRKKKPLEEFHRNKALGGRHYVCKSCRSKRRSVKAATWI